LANYALVGIQQEEGGVIYENDISAQEEAEKKGAWFQKKDENQLRKKGIKE
jgi:hypothetical protein